MPIDAPQPDDPRLQGTGDTYACYVEFHFLNDATSAFKKLNQDLPGRWFLVPKAKPYFACYAQYWPTAYPLDAEDIRVRLSQDERPSGVKGDRRFEEGNAASYVPSGKRWLRRYPPPDWAGGDRSATPTHIQPSSQPADLKVVLKVPGPEARCEEEEPSPQPAKPKARGDSTRPATPTIETAAQKAPARKAVTTARVEPVTPKIGVEPIAPCTKQHKVCPEVPSPRRAETNARPGSKKPATPTIETAAQRALGAAVTTAKPEPAAPKTRVEPVAPCVKPQKARPGKNSTKPSMSIVPQAPSTSAAPTVETVTTTVQAAATEPNTPVEIPAAMTQAESTVQVKRTSARIQANLDAVKAGTAAATRAEQSAMLQTGFIRCKAIVDNVFGAQSHHAEVLGRALAKIQAEAARRFEAAMQVDTTPHVDTTTPYTGVHEEDRESANEKPPIPPRNARRLQVGEVRREEQPLEQDTAPAGSKRSNAPKTTLHEATKLSADLAKLNSSPEPSPIPSISKSDSKPAPQGIKAMASHERTKPETSKPKPGTLEPGKVATGEIGTGKLEAGK